MHIPTHAMAGWLLAQPLSDRRDRQLVTFAAVVADLDGLTILGGIDFYQHYHHTFGHNVFVWAFTAIFCAILARAKRETLFLSAMAYGGHLLLDMLGSGQEWPILLLWPISKAEFSFFPPFQWELASWQNFTFGLFCLVLTFYLGLRKGRTILEVISGKMDLIVVDVIRSRFRK